ncbi:MAG: amidohydrolase family protein [Lishizhenia sp.]
MRFVVFFVISFIHSIGFSQLAKPENGVAPSEANSILLRNCEIIVSPEKTISKGSIHIENGRIKHIGLIVPPVKGAVEIDMKGQTIVPSFIETYASFGIEKEVKKNHGLGQQLESKKNGAFYWNEAVHPETQAIDNYAYNQKEAKRYMQMGFGVISTHLDDGIVRGTSSIVALGENDIHKAIINDNAAQYFSFSKGSANQAYPSSQMGSIALLNQFFEDAKWYETNEKNIEKNLSLEKYNAYKELPFIFKTQDKLEVLRAIKIAKNNALEFIVVGGGDEYERLPNFNDSTPLIVPINFPSPYEVKDPYVARQIPLGDLKKWELAPSNPYFLSTRNVPFAITSNAIEEVGNFWENLRKAIERGLSKEDALASLTTIPAKFLKIDEEFGTLEVNKRASFSVFSKDPFVYKDAQILESWNLGKQTILKITNHADVRGNYNITLNSEKYSLLIKGKKEQPAGEIISFKTSLDSTTLLTKTDTLKSKVFIDVERNDVALQFNIADNHFNGSITLHAKFNPRLGVFEGQGLLPTGEWIKWIGIKNTSYIEEQSKNDRIRVDSLSTKSIWYPNMAYGFETLPQQHTYVLENATVWTNEEQGILKEANVVIKEGKINFVGKGNYSFPNNAIQIDATGLHITPGIIDEHSHIAISKGVNESGQANSAEVNIGDVVRSNDINLYRQLSGGVTASQLLHGSANPIGGQSALIKLKWGFEPTEMLIPNAPKFIKFALGENVKQTNWGDYNTTRFPQTRMGVEQVFYDAFLRAKAYKNEWETYNSYSDKKKQKLGLSAPAVDKELEIIWEIVNSERFISCHSYIQSEINMLMHVADSMGFTVNTFTHILEGYKLADKMKAHGAGGSTFSDWWAYKYEVNDAIPHNASLMNDMGVVVAINSDDAEMGRRLNQEAAKVMKYGGATEEEAFKMITLNPAKLLHLDDRMGSLKKGKDADVVIWSSNPLTIQAKVKYSFVDGYLLYDSNRDKEMRTTNAQERARIISKMLEAKEKGEAPTTFVKKKTKHYHCDTIGE